MNIRNKVRALENPFVATSTSPDLKSIFRKIEVETELTVPEVEVLLYAVECDNPSLFSILCDIHAVLDTGSQADIDLMAAAIKTWAQTQKINLDY